MCSFVGVGYLGLFGLRLKGRPWPVWTRFLGPREEVSGDYSSGHADGVCLVLGLFLEKERAGKEPRQEKEMTEKELLILFPRRGGRRRRVKRSRKTAIWLWLCSSAKLQSS